MVNNNRILILILNYEYYHLFYSIFIAIKYQSVSRMEDEKAKGFYQWRRKMEIKDEQQLLQHREKKKIEMQLTKEAAIKAFNDKLKANKLMASKLKQQNKEMLSKKDKQQQSQLQKRQKLVQDVGERKTAHKQKQVILEKNKKLHDEEKEKMQYAAEKRRQQKFIELTKKRQLIREIKEYIQQPRNTIKIVDPHETMGFGLLEQMSLMELRVKLREVEEESKKKEQQKRKQILENKSITDIEKREKLKKVLRERQLLGEQREEERRVRKLEIEEQRQKMEAKRLKSMEEFTERQKIKNQLRKKQKQQLEKELQQISQKRQFLNQNQAAVEFNAFKNLQLGAERQILERQNNKLMNQYKMALADCKQKTLIGQNRRRKIQQKIQFHKTYEQNRKEANRVYEELQNQDKLQKATMFQEVKTFEQKHSQSMAKRGNYSTKVNQMTTK